MVEKQRLILRPFTKDDAADVYEYLHEPMVHCFEDMRINSIEEATDCVSNILLG